MIRTNDRPASPLAPSPSEAGPARGATSPLDRVVERAEQDLAAPAPWRLSPRGIAVRLFLTCWLLYAMHFATNSVREVFLGLAIGDHLSFRVTEYAGMHSDLFYRESYGWYMGNNPGASMVAAIPYVLSRPVVDRVVERVQQARLASGQGEPPVAYQSPWPMAQEFFQEAWRRGVDIKLGLGAFVMQAFAMAPVSAAAAVAMFYLMRRLLGSDKTALGLALLYAFGTAVFFRSGTLNHNLMFGHLAFLGFLAMWNPGGNPQASARLRYVLGGLAGGAALLFDYAGVVVLVGLFVYGLAKRWAASGSNLRDVATHGAWFVLGMVGPLLLLWYYQWTVFGHPFYPSQHWQPYVEWIDQGYRGFGFPQLDLFLSLGFDYRFGFFVASPLMLLALAAPWVDRGGRRVLPRLELWTLLLMFVAFWLFFSGSNYSRLQFNTGVRYMTTMLPFMFVVAAVVLVRLPRPFIYGIAVVSVVEAWCLAMHRDVERGLGVLDPILHVFLGGFKLPALTTLSRMGDAYGDYFANGVSPLPLFALAAVIIYGLWAWPATKRRLPAATNIAIEPLRQTADVR